MIAHSVTNILTNNIADFSRYSDINVTAPDDIV